MTDREKIVAVMESMDVDVEEKKNSIIAAGRRFYFTETGEIEKILDYRNHLIADENGTRER